MKAMIQVKNIRKVYRVGEEKIVALNNINVTIEEGEVCCIFGTSGSGKSTLLNLLAGLEKPTRGEIIINQTPVTGMNENQMAAFRQRHLGFIFQAYNLLPYLTAAENVALPLMFRGVEEKTRNRQAAQLLKKVGLGKRMYHYPTQMSGGQQQRVGIARAFAAHPEVVFADEPTGNLDTRTTKEIMTMMLEIARKHRQTLVLVTHDPEMAGYADRIVKLIDGEIVEDHKVRRTGKKEQMQRKTEVEQ